MKIPFLWGASTSAYQIEGGIFDNDWHFLQLRRLSEKEYHVLPNLISSIRGVDKSKRKPAGNAAMTCCPEFYLKDFENAKSLGMNSFGICIEW